MKNIIKLIVVLLCLLSIDAVAQEARDTVYAFVEEMPEYPGDLYRYLSNEIRYPAEDRKKNKQGKVILQFIVEKDGSLTDITIIKSATKRMDEESLRVIRNMEKWKPAMQNGKPVRLMFTLPIAFKLT
ncbi:MAG: energy transducer TonB [Bacteroidota bacterium]